jgi:hypothetical protein
LPGGLAPLEGESFVIARTAVEPNPTIVLAADDPETVVPDLVQPQSSASAFQGSGVGDVDAPDEPSAIEAAIKIYNITDPEYQRRLAVRRIKYLGIAGQR